VLFEGGCEHELVLVSDSPHGSSIIRNLVQNNGRELPKENERHRRKQESGAFSRHSCIIPIFGRNNTPCHHSRLEQDVFFQTGMMAQSLISFENWNDAGMTI